MTDLNINVNAKYRPIFCRQIQENKSTIQSAATESVAKSSKDQFLKSQSFNDKNDTIAHEKKMQRIGLMSLFIPGTGQMVNNQWGKGFGFMLGSIVSYTLIGSLPGIGFLGYLLGGLIHSWSTYDAYKNA